MRHGFPLFVFFLLIVSVCFSFYDPTLPSDTGVVAEGPAQIRENFRALKEDQIVDAGTLQGVELLDIMRTDGTNADSPVFPGAVTVTGQFKAADGAEFNGVASAVKILGNPAAPTNSIGGMAGADVWNNVFILGSDRNANTRNDTGNKYAYYAMPNRLNATKPISLLCASSVTAGNTLSFGFGGDMSGLTAIDFYTSANGTTVTDTFAARINSSQQILIATTTAAIDSAVKLKLNGGMEITSGSGFLVIGTDTRAVNHGLTVASDVMLIGTTTASGPMNVTGKLTASDGAEFNGTASAVKILGNPAATAVTAKRSDSGFFGLDVANGGISILAGADNGATTRTDSTLKVAAFAGAHYLNAEEPALGVLINSEPSVTTVSVGGGSSRGNSCNVLNFYTGVNYTTVTGTERARINSTGQLLIATTTAAVDSAVKLKLNGGMEIASGGFAVIGSDTRMAGYALTVGGTASDSIYCGGDVNALSFTDRSDAPADLAEAYAIIQSHEAKDGKVDHSKLHAAAWGKKFRVVETDKTLIKTREIAPAEEGGKATIEEYSEPEKIVVSEPDQQGRNLSMVISAQALVIADLAKRLEALEAR